MPYRGFRASEPPPGAARARAKFCDNHREIHKCSPRATVRDLRIEGRFVICNGEALIRAGSLKAGGDHLTRDTAYGRNGLPAGIEGWTDEINDPAWATAAGLMMYSARLKTRKEFKRRIPGLRGLILR